MAKLRVGFGSDFNITGQKVGIGTTNPTALLEVAGIAKADFNITGVTTLTAYGGFVAQNQYVNKPSAIGFATVGVGTLTQYYETETGFTDLGGVHHGDDQRFNTLSEDLVIDDGQILNITNTDMVGFTTTGDEYDPHNHSSYVCAGSLEQVSVTGHFSVPNGGSNDRQSFIEGTVRFNDDLNTLEFFNGVEWRQFTYNQGQSGRGVFGGGSNPSLSPVFSVHIDFVNIQSLGNAQNFGDLTIERTNLGACSSEIRGIFVAGNDASYLDRIDYITIASQGNAIDFGNVSTTNRSYFSSCSSSTRGLANGGYTPSPAPGGTVNVIDRIEISTLGDAIDFGDLFHKVYAAASTSSSTRAIVAGGVGTPDLGTNPSTRHGQIQAYGISSGGTSIDFGQLSVARWNVNGMSNGTRGVFGGGQGPTYVSMIDYVTIASEGNSLQFGELSTIRDGVGATSDRTRGLFAGGRETTSPGSNGIKVIEYITMVSLGNPVDFGDLTVGRHRFPGISDSHGGLGGF